ncbi:NAD-dependent epimerase/dehydratase family protein [Pedobacter sp.]|uniref:NAD-dependent epimerase/dehydratase family protein n=1 Tax=Pedobacter sp. TaxID=1411316 RepID=UPI003D7F5BF1
MFTIKNKVVVVTGGAGFVGANLVKKINHQGLYEVVIIDQYDEKKFDNLLGLSFVDYLSYHKGWGYLEQELNRHDIAAIFHIGANADVLVKDAALMMHVNYDHSRFYLQYSQQHEIPFIYASSSAIYGNSRHCIINSRYEHPLNSYGWSKWMFDQYVTQNCSNFSGKVIGLRFFNIFGMGEFHKGRNASLPHRFYKFIQETGTIELFDQNIRRDYVWVNDVIQVITDVLNDATLANGIYNLGSGHAITHQDLAKLVANVFIESGIKSQEEIRIVKIPLPDTLVNNFQFYTQAEQLPEFVKKYTANTTEKIQHYLREMIAREYKGHIPVN